MEERLQVGALWVPLQWPQRPRLVPALPQFHPLPEARDGAQAAAHLSDDAPLQRPPQRAHQGNHGPRPADHELQLLPGSRQARCEEGARGFPGLLDYERDSEALLP